MAHHWIQKASKKMEEKGTKGSFTRAASKHHMTTKQFENEVLGNKDKYSSKMVKKANFARNVSK